MSAALASFGAVPPAQWVPDSHGSHTGGEDAVPAAVCTVPAAHAPAGRHASWFGALEYVPSAHGAHARSADALPAALTCEPGVHVLHAMQLVAFDDALNSPLGHAEHDRSDVAEGAPAT